MQMHEPAGGGVTYRTVETPNGYIAEVNELAAQGWRIVTTNADAQGIVVSVTMERAARYPQIETKEDTNGA